MQFDHGNLATRPPRPILPPREDREDLIYDLIFKAYIRQDMFSDSPPENVSTTSVGSGVVQSSQPATGANPKEHNTALEPIGPHELTQYPQEQGHFPSGELGESAEQQVPQFPDAYTDQQDDYLYDIQAQDQWNSTGVTDTNMQNIPSAYEQPFTSRGFPNVPPQAQLGDNNISTPDAYPEEQDENLYLIPANQGYSSLQFAQSAGNVAMANTNLPNIPDSYEQFFTSLSNNNISTPDAYPEQQNVHPYPEPASDQGDNSFQFAQSAGFAMANTNYQNIPSSNNQTFTSLGPRSAPAQVQQPSNPDTFPAEQLQAFCQSLNPQARAYMAALLTGAGTARTQTGVSNNPINGVSGTRTAQPGGQAVYQSNSQWNQTVNTQTPMARQHLANQPQEGQWNRTANTHTQMARPVTQPQMHSRYNALHAPAQTQMPTNRIPFVPNVPPGTPSYRSQQMESKPDAVEQMERLYEITIRPQDYGNFTQGQSPRLNKNNMNTPGYSRRPQFVQGSSNNGGAFSGTAPMKRKREEDEVLTPYRPRRRRRVSSQYRAEPHSSSLPPSSPPSPLADEDPYNTSFYGNRKTLDEFFVPAKRGNEAGFSCQYKYPHKDTVCHIFVTGGDRCKRYRHLSTHAQHEESLIAVKHLKVADAVMLSKLSKLLVECDISGCNWRKEVWRTDQVRENHEKECHPEAYASRVQDREDKKHRRMTKSEEAESEGTMLEEMVEGQS